MRRPYRERFSIILNDLGAGLAARGDELGDIIERANPALRETDKILAILASQDKTLARLARDSNEVLAPLARERAESPASSTPPATPLRPRRSAAPTSSASSSCCRRPCASCAR